MSKYIIFDTEQEAISLNDRINAELMPIWKDGITNNYCEVRKHPTLNKFAIVVLREYEYCFTNEELNKTVELTSDWEFPIPQ